MNVGNVYITIELNTRQFRKRVYTTLHNLMKLDLRWKRFFYLGYWSLWTKTGKVFIEDVKDKVKGKLWHSLQ